MKLMLMISQEGSYGDIASSSMLIPYEIKSEMGKK